MQAIERFLERFSHRLIWVFISIYVLVFCYLCFLKFYSFGYFDWDFASDISVLWNSVNGRFFYYPFLEQIIFGVHLYLIVLLLIPVYAVFQHPLTILFLQSLFLGLAAYPLYLLARLKLNKTFALVLGLAYLLYPPLGFINLFESHFEIYVIFFLFFALYYFERENFSKFIIFIFLAIICKENVSLVVFMLGIYALLRRRSRRWILAPTLLGISYFFLALKVVIPFFNPQASLYQDGFMFTRLYQHLGSNIFEMMKTIIFHPLGVARFALTQRKILYLFQIFSPTGFLVILSPAPLLIALPIFMQNLLSSGRTHATIYYHYVGTLIPFIFYSLIHAFKKLLAYKHISKHSPVLLLVFLTVVTLSCITLGAPQLYLARYIKAYEVNDFTKEKDKLVQLIPKHAPTIATFQFLPKLAHRYDLYSMHLVSTGLKMYTKEKYEPVQNLEYALIDFNEPLLIGSFFSPEGPANIRLFLENGNWSPLRAVDDVVLFKKDYHQGAKLCAEVKNPKIENSLDININNQIVLLGYDVGGNVGKGNILHFVYYWKRIGQSDDQLGLLIQFLDSEGNIRFKNIHSLGYRVYAPETWPLDEIVKENYYMLVPSEIEKGNYNLRAFLFRLRDKRILPLLSGGEADFRGSIALGNIVLE